MHTHSAFQTTSKTHLVPESVVTPHVLVLAGCLDLSAALVHRAPHLKAGVAEHAWQQKSSSNKVGTNRSQTACPKQQH